MGLFVSSYFDGDEISERPDRQVFVRNTSMHVDHASIKRYLMYQMDICYQRYKVTIIKPYSEFVALEKLLRKEHNLLLVNIRPLPKPNGCSCTHNSHEVQLKYVTSFMQHVLDQAELFLSDEVRNFLSIDGPYAFKPELGRHGKDGLLYKISGGYNQKFSNRPGDYISIYSKRYFVFRENHFEWYDPNDLTNPKGVMFVDSHFHALIDSSGTSFTLSNKTRSLKIRAFRTKQAAEWASFFRTFYGKEKVPRRLLNDVNSSFPVRDNIDCRVYTISRDYFAAVAKAILSAKKEIFIACWKNSPTLLLTRPPLPPIRLDQLLKYKADLGVKIHILLYKEVEIAGQGNNSLKAMEHLQGLSKNIEVIRHPNKLIGGSTAILWSHHEKIVIVDRNLAFIGGIDLAFNRWDDEFHSCVDEDGIKYPGADYRQPGIGKFRPAVVEFEDCANTRPSNAVDPSAPAIAPPLASTITSTRKGSLTDHVGALAEVAKNQLSSIAESAKTHFNKYVWDPYVEKTKLRSLIERYPLRELYPRTAWHDVQASVSGLPARDISSHFVQRWNHHRISSGSTSMSPITDVTDEIDFGACARCQLHSLTEDLLSCPSCNYDLGRISYFLEEPTSDVIPPTPDSFSYTTFECLFAASTGCIFNGDGPSVVTEIVDDITPLSNRLISVNGEKLKIDMSDSIEEWIPRIGDIVVSVNDIPVTHLNHLEFSRLVKRVRQRTNEPVKLTFRRFLFSVDDQDFVSPEQGLQLIEAVSFEPSAPILEGFGDEDSSVVPDVISITPLPDAANDKPSAPLAEAQPIVGDDVVNPVYTVDNASLMDDSPASSIRPGRNRSISTNSTMLLKYAMTKEILLSMSMLFHENSYNVQLPSKKSNGGTNKVQVLRSAGPWSLGTWTESSIMTSYFDSIKNAKKFIYIENQFFIGNLAGPHVKNNLASAIVERIIQASNKNEKFCVIVLIPQHPSGDVTQSQKTKIVLNYEYLTINRGKLSVFELLKSRLPPGIQPEQYIKFYCLRSRGVLQNKFYSDQIYVHDKILIVDDQIAIIGSANMNDRSMLGDRDSELAIRIEDTEKITIMMNNQPYNASKSVHEFRMRLMSQHVGADVSERGLIDVLNESTFHNIWDQVADRNTFAYDCLDGLASVYKCQTLAEYRTQISQYSYPAIDDPESLEIIKTIKGFLVHFPLNFLSKEDMSPSIALRAVVSNNLWV